MSTPGEPQSPDRPADSGSDPVTADRTPPAAAAPGRDPSAAPSATSSPTAPATTVPAAGVPIGRANAKKAGLAGLALGAIGVVFGDIGTSPLYAMQTIFSIDDGAVRPTESDVYGVVSLVFWSITLIVSVKYVAFVLRADNDGEGGIMALAALVRSKLGGRSRVAAAAIVLGVLGASLFYGDSLITPAISVLSAVEGLEVVDPGAADLVLPVGVAIVVVLFLVQRLGTHKIGRLFGPVMIIWFVVLIVTGLPQVIEHPGILRALSPTHIVDFVADHPFTAFIAMGAVVLSITGAEALYADMGHFGRRPIRTSWFCLVFPALVVNYMGQGALILHDPASIENPFYLLAPGWARLPLVVLATFATVIASQAVISGAFSVSKQAVRLGYLPQLRVHQTSEKESGQIYVPAVNWLLFAGVLVLMLAFESSSSLATAYGLAVTGTLLLTTTLFLVLARSAWHWPLWWIVVLGIVFGGTELTFFAANLTKVVHGGWLPLLVAVVVVTVMLTWHKGRLLITTRREQAEGSLADFVEHIRQHPLPRSPGTAVFPHPTKTTTPLALKANTVFNRVLHQHVVVVSIRTENVPHIPPDERITVDDLGYTDDGIVHLELRVGFQDAQDIPGMLRMAVGRSDELDFDPDTAMYFLSRAAIERGRAPGMARWRKRIFVGLAHNAASPALAFKLPEDRTVVMGSRIDL
ncbi:potassium transporter Kup [Nakamurella sp. YIM 132087]|uniref:Probable potassium transport system protein Kup n=1 Tax=Nakamurella alba TaxID=2665158 RepID=A0A7K1FM93_9ACTN|nr:potassium transporter Kup [Nakamurella alba]MTD13994.1 potassium transporter Kup [Nakamurella alba]